MKQRLLIVAVLIFVVGLVAGCNGGADDNPFVGSWVSANRGRITFAGSTWSDSDGDGGTYSYTGTHPVYELTFASGRRTVVDRATFIDTRTLELCPVISAGLLGACDELVIDRPTLH